jgi:ankyrin repeat protein
VNGTLEDTPATEAKATNMNMTSSASRDEQPLRGSGGSVVVAIEEDNDNYGEGGDTKKPVEGILSEPRRGLGVVAIEEEEDSPAIMEETERRASVTWKDTVKKIAYSTVAEKSVNGIELETRTMSQVPLGRSGSLSLGDLTKQDSQDETIPGPDLNSAISQISPSELDLSITEHHIKGGGILASQRELNLSMEEFAAGCNLLQVAARGDRAAMEALLERYPNHGNFRDYDRRTALHVAASEGHVDICKFLVEEKGVRINRSDRWGGSPLDDAHRHRQEDVVKFLREHGATTGSLDQTTNLIAAAAEGDIEEVRLLLSISHNLQINAGDYDLRTALHLAAGEGRMEVVQLLCAAGANVNVHDRWGGSPLNDAERNRHDDVAQFLRSRGAVSTDAFETEDHEENKRSALIAADNMRVEFQELEMIERIGAGAFGEIYKCRWRGTLVAAKCIKSAKIQREWLSNHAMATIKKRKGNVDDAMQLMDEAELSESLKDEAMNDFRQEISVLRELRYVCNALYNASLLLRWE